MFGYTRSVQASLVAACVSLSFFSISAHATLSSYNNAGADLVYSSVSDATWTKDADLLGAMWAADSNLISKIIAASPTVNHTPTGSYPSGVYTINASDFYAGTATTNAAATWFGAMAFTYYLNSISYGGSQQWVLPNTSQVSVFGGLDVQNGTVAGEEFAELYYGELGGSSVYGPGGVNSGFLDTANQFDHEQNGISFQSYWYAPFGGTNSSAFFSQFGQTSTWQSSSYSGVWAISSGKVMSASVVPEPESLGLLLLGLGIVGATVRRQKQQ